MTISAKAAAQRHELQGDGESTRANGFPYLAESTLAQSHFQPIARNRFPAWPRFDDYCTHSTEEAKTGTAVRSSSRRRPNINWQTRSTNSATVPPAQNA